MLPGSLWGDRIAVHDWTYKIGRIDGNKLYVWRLWGTMPA